MSPRKLKLNPPRAIVFYQICGFGIIILFLWLDEIFDIPHFLFGSIETPVNISESLFESIMILIVSIFCIVVTIRLLSKIKGLEGLVPICSSCKKIRDDHNHWHHIETYIESRSSAHFSHGLCQECIEEMYGNQDWYRNRKNVSKASTKPSGSQGLPL